QIQPSTRLQWKGSIGIHGLLCVAFLAMGRGMANRRSLVIVGSLGAAAIFAAAVGIAFTLWRPRFTTDVFAESRRLTREICHSVLTKAKTSAWTSLAGLQTSDWSPAGTRCGNRTKVFEPNGPRWTGPTWSAIAFRNNEPLLFSYRVRVLSAKHFE